MKGSILKRVDVVEDRVLRDAIVPPPDLVPYLKGEKLDFSGKARPVFERWISAVGEALERGVIEPEELLDSLPEPLRSQVIEGMRQRLQ